MPFETIEAMPRQRLPRSRPRPSDEDYALPQELSDALVQLLSAQQPLPRTSSRKKGPRSAAPRQVTLGGKDAKHS